MASARFLALATSIALATAPLAAPQVFINEVFINPPGSYDSSREYIELQGTPNMKLDGFAVCLVYGRQEKYFTQGEIPPQPADEPEIDELFSLDGLALGKNGLLVIGIGDAAEYPLLPDTAFSNWLNIWNGPLDVPNKLQNDGSITVFLVRNRPGQTQANPFDPAGPVWVKDSSVDREITFNVVDPQDGIIKDQCGDGKLDVGGVNIIGEPMNDFFGKTTIGTLADDLGIVDEVSYEHDRGYEYDLDARKSDVGSVASGIEERHVHNLDDPQGINPDVLTRVDYRTKGIGWAPVGGATGQMANGNNWQDTATEQWIRGETLQFITGGLGTFPFFYYDVNANVDPNALQPFFTNVPSWLADGQGIDFSFTPQTYQVLAGHVNALAIPFIPGDADRDGDVDGDDIAKIRSIFLQDDSLFINSYPSAPNGDAGDPATQTRPWDVNGTGDNGIDPNDLQWALNFQGDTTGRIQGVSYDDTGPATSGVKLNDGSAVGVTFSTQVSIPCGAAANALRINDVVEITVRIAVTSGANTNANEQNGVMQFANDLALSTGGVLKAESVVALGSFSLGNESYIQYPIGGVIGAQRINGFTPSFTQGLSGSVDLYRVRLRAIAAGTTNLSIFQSLDTRLYTAAPQGVKIGHTDLGDPGSVNYPAQIQFTVTASVGGLIAEYGTGCIGTGGFTPRLSGEGCATPGGSITLSITQGNPGSLPNLFIGLGNGSGNLNPHCAIQVLPILPAPIVLIPLLGSGAGYGFLTIPGLVIPPTVPLGISTYLQSLQADPAGFGGVSATNPLKITFGL